MVSKTHKSFFLHCFDGLLAVSFASDNCQCGLALTTFQASCCPIEKTHDSESLSKLTTSSLSSSNQSQQSKSFLQIFWTEKEKVIWKQKQLPCSSPMLYHASSLLTNCMLFSHFCHLLLIYALIYHPRQCVSINQKRDFTLRARLAT